MKRYGKNFKAMRKAELVRIEKINAAHKARHEALAAAAAALGMNVCEYIDHKGLKLLEDDLDQLLDAPSRS